VYVNHLQAKWVHRLPFAKFAYNHSIHASTGITIFFAEKGFHPSIQATVWVSPADRYMHNVPDVNTWVEKLLELWAAIKQHWKEVTTTEQKYAARHTKPVKD
jgi:hypothetical protein